MNSQTTLDSVARRFLYVVLAAVMMLASLSLFKVSNASASSQVTFRSITMSDSGVSGNAGITSGVGSGTNVTYKVGFTAIGPAAASSMVIDFCSTSPIMDDTCTAPTGLNVSTAALGATALSGTVSTTNGWSVTATANQIKLAEASAGAGDIVAGAQSFELSGITNPSTLGTFYARMYTYSGTSWATYTSPTSHGSPIDYGGIALSTTSTITITARVQEQITFCVTNADPATWTTTHDCSDSAITPPAITLGHGSPTAVLDANHTDTASIWTQLSTNATNGAVINLRNSNSCGGLSADNGVTCGIPAINSGGATPVLFDTGAYLPGAGFGLYVDYYTAALGIGDTTPDAAVGTIGVSNPAATYNDGTHKAVAPWTDGSFVHASLPAPYFAMDTGVTGTTSTYGSTVASTAGPVYRADNQYVFAATAGVSTPAGIYTANMSMISTGTF
jgi:hypothetical protein